MRAISREALVGHSTSDMFSLVDDIETYPQFLPWCAGATVHARSGNVVDASIELHRGLIRKSFRTRNTLRHHDRIDIALVGGPFRHLAGGWRFQQLGALGCKVSLDLEFEFVHRMTSMAFGPVFEDICNSLVDAFTERATVIYGQR